MPAKTHGMWGTHIYGRWVSMIDRCHNKNSKDYQWYGARGIRVCERWRVFSNYFEDMWPSPGPFHTIDRIDNDKGYSPENCKWSTTSEQSRNKSLYKSSKTGINGVQTRGNKYRARIGVGGRNIDLGDFTYMSEAIEARRQGEIKYWSKK